MEQQTLKEPRSKALHKAHVSGTFKPQDFKLCYVDDGFAYFTTKPLTEQWGDDWNDAPYEHNAKTYAMTNGVDFITVDGSGNWSENPRLENFTITNDKAKFDFRRQWMEELCEKE